MTRKLFFDITRIKYSTSFNLGFHFWMDFKYFELALSYLQLTLRRHDALAYSYLLHTTYITQAHQSMVIIILFAHFTLSLNLNLMS